MRKIKWYSEENDLNEIFQNCRTTIYHFSEFDKVGYVVFNNEALENFSIIAVGKFGDKELHCKIENSFLLENRIIQNNTQRIGGIGYEYIKLNAKGYNINVVFKSIFNLSQRFDVKMEFYHIYTNILAILYIDRIQKKWYKSISDSNLEGNIEIIENLEDDFIISIFFHLHYYIQRSSS